PVPASWSPRFCLRNGARETNTRKHAKGDESCGLGARVTSRDPTLDAVGTRSGVACPKNVQRQYLTCPFELFRRHTSAGPFQPFMLIPPFLCARPRSIDTRRRTRGSASPRHTRGPALELPATGTSQVLASSRVCFLYFSFFAGLSPSLTASASLMYFPFLVLPYHLEPSL